MSYDIADQHFYYLCENLGIDAKEASSSLNWDILVCQALETPIYTTDDLLTLWTYKFAKAWHDIGIIANKPAMVERMEIIRRFLSYTINRLPEDLSVEEMLEFRKNSVAANFRAWLATTVQQASHDDEITETSIDLRLLQKIQSIG